MSLVVGGINIVSLHICSVSRRSVVSFVVFGRKGVVMAEKGKLRLPRFSVRSIDSGGSNVQYVTLFPCLTDSDESEGCNSQGEGC